MKALKILKGAVRAARGRRKEAEIGSAARVLLFARPGLASNKAATNWPMVGAMGHADRAYSGSMPSMRKRRQNARKSSFGPRWAPSPDTRSV
jgi:hypothetical protein